MSQSIPSENFLNHKWTGEFLNNRFRVKAWPESFGDKTRLNFEWDPIVPWTVKMTPKTRAKFVSEYDLFISVLLRDWATIIDNKVLFVDPEIGGCK